MLRALRLKQYAGNAKRGTAMATLMVTASHDYSGDSLSNITDIVFSSSGAGIATFDASQFDDVHISRSVHITGSPPPFLSGDIEIKNANVFSAGTWTFTTWSTGSVLILGTSVADILVGSSGPNQFEAGAGADTLSGGPGRDTFYYGLPTDVSSGETIAGNAGTDTILLGGHNGDVFDF